MKTKGRVHTVRSQDQLTLALTQKAPTEGMDTDARTRVVAAVAQVLLAAHHASAEVNDDAR